MRASEIGKVGGERVKEKGMKYIYIYGLSHWNITCGNEY